MMTKTKCSKIDAQRRVELIRAFEALPDHALFSEETPAAVVNEAARTMQRRRWDGSGPKFLKIGRAVRYRKRDILDWLGARASQPLVHSAATAKPASTRGDRRR